MTSWSQAIVFFLLATLSPLAAVGGAPIAPGVNGYESRVKPFFKTHCVKCHGPTKSKGEITLHSLDGDLSAGRELERWEAILDVLTHSEMPPEDEPQPKEAERQQIAKWIESGLRDYAAHASQESPQPTARRLTNVAFHAAGVDSVSRW